MQINISQKYGRNANMCDVLTPESKQAILDAACELYGAYWDLTLGAFFRLAKGDCSDVFKPSEEPTIAQVYWMNGLQDFAAEFEKSCKSVQLPRTLMRKYEQQAQSACLKMTPEESMLVFVQKYFGLHNFRDGENITLAEYMMARRAQYNEIVMQRRMEQLQMAEIKKGQKK